MKYKSLIILLHIWLHIENQIKGSVDRTCENPSDHPEEDLAKSGYKSNMIDTSLIILLYIWLSTGNQNIAIWQQVLFSGRSFLPLPGTRFAQS